LRRPRAWLLCCLLFLAPDSPVLGDEENAPATSGKGAPGGPHWVDDGHAFATNRAQALAQWLDDFFGAEVRDAERVDTFIRLIGVDNWDERDGHDPTVRVRGQLNLPKISERLDLIFSGEENEQTLTEDERSRENDVGLRFNVQDDDRLRLDATLSVRSNLALLPGLRARYQQPLSDDSWYRLTQRIQYDTSDGYRALSNIDVNHYLDEHSLLRWGARLRYQEDKGFWDWNSGITWRRWLDDHQRFPSAVEVYLSLSGRDDPQPFNSNYRVGVLFRQQFFRDYLFYEVEPNFDWRQDRRRDGREGVWGIVLRVEMMLDDDLIRRRRR